MSSDVTPHTNRSTRRRGNLAGVVLTRGGHSAEKVRQIHGRLARLNRETPPSRLPHRSRSAHASGTHEGSSKPQEATGSVARAVATYQQAHPSKNPNTAAALHAISAKIGGHQTSQLGAGEVQTVVATWAEFTQHTRSNYTKALKRFLRWLEEAGQAPARLHRQVPRIHQPSPRAVVATDDERDRLLEAASPRLRFFLQLCGDLGIRHRTATRITIANYNPLLRSLSFTTKGNAHQTLPVTDAIADTISSLPANCDRTTPIVTLLRPPKQEGHPPGKNPRFIKAFNKLKRELGIRDELHIHDLRRTAAEDVWDATHDIRMVQAQLGHSNPITTVRYLANRVKLQDLQPVVAKVQAMRAARAKATQRTP